MDLENGYQYDLGRDFCSDAVRTFCGKLEKAGYFTGLYTSTSWLDSVIDQDIKDKYTIWVADWRGYCGYDGNYGMWQYGVGYVPGIKGKTDLDIIDIGFDIDYPTGSTDGDVDMDYAYEDFPSLIIPNGLNNYPKPDDTAWDNDPCRDVGNTLDIKGYTPKLSGDNWFLIDENCKFTLETIPYANVNIYLVGGGQDGAEWALDKSSGKADYRIATKSRGGCVLKKQIYIKGNVECQAFVAIANDCMGTSIKIGKDLYKCTDSGYIHRKATASGNVNLDAGGNYNAESGANGISTPYGYVGSSGGGGGTYSIQNYQYIEVGAGKGGAGAGDGGAVRENGTDAVNYGCGGGAAGFDGLPSDGGVVGTHAGRGMGGCIIFEILDSGACDGSPNKPVGDSCSCGCSCGCSHHEFTCPDPAESTSHCEQEKNYKLEYNGGKPIITENTVVSPSNSNTQNSWKEVAVTGITPAKSGTDRKYGKWFLIDQSGTFSVDDDITATVWLVGGGCDGEGGVWSSDTFTALGGKGGDGGYVRKVSDVRIIKNSNCNTVIADVGDVSGTTLEVSGNLLRCDQSGYTSTIGGSSSSITGNSTGSSFSNKVEPGNGQTGVTTPYQVVGSSGGGAMACDGHDHRTKQGSGGTGAGKGGGHREEGNNATNYGCGGGGGDGCGAVAKGNDGGKGKKGCIIIAYKVTDCDCPKPSLSKNCGCTFGSSCSSGNNNNHSCGCGLSGNGRCVSYDIQKWGENWLLFDKSGEYSLEMDDDITFSAYLVGGGSDGQAGIYYNKTAYGGDGGRGGLVNIIRNIKVSKGKADITVKIGERGDYDGTYVVINNNEYSCNGLGNTVNDGGFQGISGRHGFRNAGNGTNGIETPFGYIGSSGGGGAAYCNGSISGRGKGGLYAGNGGKIVNGKSSPGDKATGYGCGGGGGAASPTSWCDGGKGKRGCVIINW